MMYANRRRRLLVECLSGGRVNIRYEYKTPFKWMEMMGGERRAFLTGEYRWRLEVKLEIPGTEVDDDGFDKYGKIPEITISQNELEIKTPCTIKQANQVIHKVLHAAVEGAPKVYYAKVIAEAL